MRFLLLLLISSFASQAHAYLAYTPNMNLQEEVEAHEYRVLPKSQRLFLTLDADFFKPVFGDGTKSNYYKYDFYHGNGYWMDLRSEFKPVDDLAVNLKLDFTHGTSSNGPTYLAMMIPRVGITYRQHGFLDLNWEVRLSDIDRQTVGTGLFIEQKETDGGYILAKSEVFRGKIMVDGTGSFSLDGGIIAGDFSVAEGWFGVTGFIQETETALQLQEFMGTLYSRRSWEDGLGYGVEYGGNAAGTAGLAYLKYETDVERLHFLLKPQFRKYGKGVLGKLPGNVEHNYISYDQNDKPFTNLMDIFSYGDHVETYSAQVNAEFTFNPFYRFYVESELIDYKFHDRPEVRAVYFRTGFKIHPIKDREDEVGILVGNKYLIASTTQTDSPNSPRTYSSPDMPDFENRPLFLKQLYFMINFSAKM